MRMILKVMLDLIVPPRCPISGVLVNDTGQIAPEVWSQLKFITAPHCVRCGIPFDVQLDDNTEKTCGACLADVPYYDEARAGVVYDDLTRQLILRYKHGDHSYLSRTFIPWMERAGYQHITSADIIMPVPLHWSRMIKRRYNQAALLAQAIAANNNKQYEPLWLKRVKATAPQGRRGAKERKKNVKKAFAVNNKAALEGKNILLIDDVITSGATVNECAKILKDYGAEIVNVLSVARAVKH